MDEYERLRERFSLPPFDEMQEYDIAGLDSCTIKEVLKKMESRLEYLASVLEEILQPAPDSIAHMHECRHFSQEDKEQIYVLYKQLQFCLRAIVEALIEGDEEKSATLITDIHGRYRQIKEQVLPFVRRLKESWTHADEHKEFIAYFG